MLVQFFYAWFQEKRRTAIRAINQGTRRQFVSLFSLQLWCRHTINVSLFTKYGQLKMAMPRLNSSNIFFYIRHRVCPNEHMVSEGQPLFDLACVADGAANPDE